MRSLLLPAVVLLMLSAGCGGSSSGGPASLELRKVVPHASRIGGTGTGEPLSQAARQTRDPAEQTAAVRAIDCAPGRPDPLAGHDDRALPLVTCGRSVNAAYVLEPGSSLAGKVSDVTSVFNVQSGQWVVQLEFDTEGTGIWSDFTGKNVNQEAAFVLDSQVIGVMDIRIAITDGTTQLSGRFTKQYAQELARRLEGS